MVEQASDTFSLLHADDELLEDELQESGILSDHGSMTMLKPPKIGGSSKSRSAFIDGDESE